MESELEASRGRVGQVNLQKYNDMRAATCQEGIRINESLSNLSNVVRILVKNSKNGKNGPR